jgi:hypothetical protein
MSQQQWNSGENDDVQMPLGVGGGAEPDFSVEGSGKPKFNGPTFVLFGAFAAALLVIYLLGLQNKPRAASAEQVAHEQEVQSAITELLQKNGKAGQLSGLFQDTDKLVKMFYSYLGTQTEKTPELPHDPFANDEVRAASSPEEVAVVPSNFVEAEKLRKVAETFSGLKLQSVMVGRTSVAMINNRMVTTGAKVGELTVTTIEPGRVLLNYEKNTFELKLYRPAPDQE